jgi:hypothetical protein
MNTTVELPSGKIVDLSRFVALVPDEKTTEAKYSLILEGYSQPINLDQLEAISLKKHLKLDSNGSSDWDRAAQLRRNQKAIKLLTARIERNQRMSEAESEQRAEFLADFQKTVDGQRIASQKLYSS